MRPSESHSLTSWAPASKYRTTFSRISSSVFAGDSTSTQSSGERGKQARFPSSRRHSADAQATSAARTPSAVEIGHSVRTRPCGMRLRSK